VQVVIALLWLAGTIYGVVNIVRPTKPFTKRWQGAVAVLCVFIGSGILVDALKLDEHPAPANTAAPANAVAALPTKGDVQIVRVDPASPHKGDAASAATDAGAARLEMKDQLRLIEAAEGVLVAGIQAGNRDAVQMVRREMQQLDVKLVKRRPVLGEQPWPIADDEGFLACSDAAQRLSVFAASALQELSLEEVSARQKFSDDYSKAHTKCAEWTR
jgi:hypothetical protein